MKPINVRLYTYTDKETGCKVVKAVTSYLGQTMFATAKCDPVDEFNQEFGEKLATTRLNIKVAKLRASIAEERAAYSSEYLNYLEKEQRRVNASIVRELTNISERMAELEALEKVEEDLLASVN
jgi:adenosylmethionine-8-amino-7-oxononanoate aminotransferase